MMSRVFRFAGSAFFTLSGVAYTFLPPHSTTAYFDSSWPAKSWGILFIVGGLISLWGVFSRYAHNERLGVAFVAIATFALAVNNVLLLLDVPWVPTRSGGSLFYLGCCMWAIERWYKLGKDVEVLRGLADEDADGQLTEEEQ